MMKLISASPSTHSFEVDALSSWVVMFLVSFTCHCVQFPLKVGRDAFWKLNRIETWLDLHCLHKLHLRPVPTDLDNACQTLYVQPTLLLLYMLVWLKSWLTDYTLLDHSTTEDACGCTPVPLLLLSWPSLESLSCLMLISTTEDDCGCTPVPLLLLSWPPLEALSCLMLISTTEDDCGCTPVLLLLLSWPPLEALHCLILICTFADGWSCTPVPSVLVSWPPLEVLTLWEWV